MIAPLLAAALSVLAAAPPVVVPAVWVAPPGTPLAAETTMKVYASPQHAQIVLGSLDLDLTTIVILHVGTGPAAQESGDLVSPFPPAFAGQTIDCQAAAPFEPGLGLIGQAAPQILPVY